MVGKSWSYANDRRVIELAKASKSLEEAARMMNRTPEQRIRKVAMRLGVSFKSEGKTKRGRPVL
jgi:G:T-mismatch repair DNA endonuclease (very short patch repair protein)